MRWQPASLEIKCPQPGHCRHPFLLASLSTFSDSTSCLHTLPICVGKRQNLHVWSEQVRQMPQSPWMEEGGMKDAQSVLEQYRGFLVESSSSNRVYDSTKGMGR